MPTGLIGCNKKRAGRIMFSMQNISREGILSIKDITKREVKYNGKHRKMD